MLPAPTPPKEKFKGKTKWFLHLQKVLKDNPKIITYKQLRKVADPLWIKEQNKNRKDIKK